jgi:lysozyme
MAFQLGINGFLQFRMMRQALSRCDWLAARNEALDSLWARQTPNRARRVAEQILTGEYYEIL